jgi:hypothetical protein
MMVHYLSSLPSIATIASVLLLLLPPPATSASLEEPLTWIPRSSYDATPDESLGRHHPITFANETHGFVLGGSTFAVGAVPDLHVYDEASDVWIDASRALIGSPYPPRTYGYGVVLDESRHPKAYIGFGSGADDGGGAGRLGDWWEFDMPTLEFRELARFPGEGRHHPSVVPVYVDGGWHIHVGLGDGLVGDDHSEFANFDDYWSYSVDDDAWTRLPDFPGGRRHHPYYFGMGGTSYVGFGHGDASPYIYRDFYGFSNGAWSRETDFESHAMEEEEEDGASGGGAGPVTTEGRVAGTQFSVVLPPRSADDSASATAGGEGALSGSMGFVLSGDGDDHESMPSGEFHAFRPDDDDEPRWCALPSHPGASRWAPGSFAMRGTARAYFVGGYDRTTSVLRSDVWGIDLSPLFRAGNLSPTFAPSIPPTSAPSAVPLTAETEEVSSAGPTTARTIPALEGQVNDAEDAEYDLIACIAQDECDESRSELGIDKFLVGTYPTKGCFAKNDVAYWSGGGSAEEVSRGDLPGEQERIWCGDSSSVASVGGGADDSNSQQASAIVNSVMDEGSSSTGVLFPVGIVCANVMVILLTVVIM